MLPGRAVKCARDHVRDPVRTGQIAEGPEFRLGMRSHERRRDDYEQGDHVCVPHDTRHEQMRRGALLLRTTGGTHLAGGRFGCERMPGSAMP